MESILSLVCIIFSALVCIAAPTVLAVIMIVKHKASWKAFVVGAAVFTVMQVLIRIPILTQLQLTTWFVLFAKSSPVLYILLLAFSAGVFEEGGRFIGTSIFLRRELTWENAFVFGLGHGGAEAFILVGLNYLQLIINMAAGNTPSLLAGTPPYMFLLGGIERILAVTAHIGMTMLVFYSIKFKKIIYLLYALLFHTLLDCFSLVLQPLGLSSSAWAIEGYVTVFAALAVFIIVRFKGAMNKEVESVSLTQ